MERCFVGCTPGLEAPLRDELRALGVEAKATNGGCDVTGPDGTFVTVNVQSRLASRVLLHLGHARSPSALASVPVRRIVGEGPLFLQVTSGRVSPPPEVWRQQAAKAWRVVSSETGRDPPLEVSLRLGPDGASVSVDTSGELLYLRGARQETGKAPLRETLAAGVLRLCGWTPGEPLWDTMCGSGTLLLEAGEQALGLQPGRQRAFAFERFADPRAAAVARAKTPRTPVPTWLRGSDLNAGALGVTRRNARRAGVLEALQLERLDATMLTSPEVGPGLILANLPYGKRVGNRFELASLYAGVGKALKRSLPGWRFGFLLQDGADALGLDVRQSVTVKNGGLSCLVVTGTVL
jgi:putative N6-adenine-specific DNA methylase